MIKPYSQKEKELNLPEYEPSAIDIHQSSEQAEQMSEHFREEQDRYEAMN